MNQPTSIRIGDSCHWSLELTDYPPSDSWQLKYRLLWASGPAVDITATVNGDRYDVRLSSGDTSAWQSGPATLVAFVERPNGDNVDRNTISQNSITILPNLSTAATFDNRSQAVKGLEASRAALSAYMANGQMHVSKYDIAGRSMEFRSSSEIQELIQYYEKEVVKEESQALALSGVSRGRVRVKF